MTTNVRLFKSTDAGAPTLSGTAGHLMNCLDAILVNGYGNKTVTISRAQGLATAVCATPHGFLTGQLLLISGADQAEYNGEKYITVTSDTEFSFAITEAAVTPATGVITAKIAPAGWSKAYSGVNKVAYRMGGGNQRMLRIDDSAGTSARCLMYEAMTGVDTGTNPFPTDIQVTGGLYINKSTVADTTTRGWIALATDKLLHLFINAGPSTGLICGHYLFGDIKSFVGSDAYQTMIVAQTSYSSSAVASYNAMASTQAYGGNSAGHYLARAYTQIGGSWPVGKHGDAAKAASLTAALGGAGLAYPNPSDGGLYMTPIFVHEAGALRGTIPGLWAPIHQRPLNHLDTVSGSGALAGKTFLALNPSGSSVAAGDGQLLYEISNTWEI